MRAAALDAYAELLSYPQENLPQRLDALQSALESVEGAAGRRRLTGLAAVLTDGTFALEELYTRTFDLSPACALETGWHLYGEDYDRGAFLVRIRALLREHGVAESGELPDHATHVLRLLGRLEDDAAGELARRQIMPALQRILAGFTDETNPYRALVEGVAALLAANWGPAEEVPASAFSCPPPYEGTSPILCAGPPPRPME